MYIEGDTCTTLIPIVLLLQLKGRGGVSVSPDTAFESLIVPFLFPFLIITSARVRVAFLSLCHDWNTGPGVVIQFSLCLCYKKKRGGKISPLLVQLQTATGAHGRYD